MNIPLKQTLITLLVLFGLSFAQSGFIPLMVDYAIFKNTDTTSYVEVYISFYQNNLNYISEKDHLRAGYNAMVQVFNKNSIVDSKTKNLVTAVKSPSDIHTDRQFITLFAFELPNRNYNVKVTIQDLNSNNRGEYLFDINLKNFSPDSLQISGIELASNITKEVGESDFHKNTLRIIPNPSNIYGIELPIIYHYSEIYNLDFNEKKPGNFLVNYSITDLDGNVLRSYPEKKKLKPGKSAVLVDGFNVVALPSGTYILKIQVTDPATNQVVTQKKRFTIYKPDLKQAKIENLQTGGGTQETNIAEYAYYSEEDMNKEFSLIKYIATPEDKKIYKTLTLNGKRKFLSEFWKRRENMKGSDFKHDYFERVRYANSNFGTRFKEGWKTDRGRILLTYGKPDDIQYNNMEIDKKPYEIWSYHNLEGGVMFIFADLGGFGEYELIHSTYSKEIYNPDWKRLIIRARGSSNFNMDQNE